MNRSDKILISLTILGIIIVFAVTAYLDKLNELSFLLTLIPFIAGIIKIIEQRSQIQQTRKQKLASDVNPVIRSLVNMLEEKSLEVKEGFRKTAEKFLKKDNVTEAVVLSCFEFANILKIPKQYNRGYALAMSYALSNVYILENGVSAETIDNSVRKRHTIPYGEKNELDDFEVDWYKRFCESKNILISSFDDLLKETEPLEIKQIDEKHISISRNYVELKEYTELKESKIDKLLELVIKKIPKIDFNKILSTLRTEVVIISSEGFKDDTSGSKKRGSEYLNQALNEKISSKNRLNRSVRFVLYDEVLKDRDARTFDLQRWGREIDDAAKKIRSEDNGDGRIFSFVVLKSSINELYFFGDDLPEKGMIKMPPEVLDGLKPEEITKSTLQLLAQIFNDEKISLQDFINYNLEYLEGIPNFETATLIISRMEEKFSISKWKISDFARFAVTSSDLQSIGIAEEQANTIINEAKSLTKLLKLS